MRYDAPPTLISIVQERVDFILTAINYVISIKPELPTEAKVEGMDILLLIAKRFHESVLALGKHPHGGELYAINNEWDCQYIFRSILAAYFRDVRPEEWTPSVAGSSARCEFFIKPLKTMVELKYVYNASDSKKIKSALATDFLDYGANPEVEYVVVLIYDPESKLNTAVQLQEDLSGPKTKLVDVHVIVSPPR